MENEFMLINVKSLPLYISYNGQKQNLKWQLIAFAGMEK